jgi:hypothetical protein
MSGYFLNTDSFKYFNISAEISSADNSLFHLSKDVFSFVHINLLTSAL